MRESLTVLAILLIVVLTTALVGPYFVDWNAHRGQIEKRLSSLVGANVAITGPIDVKLLPRPIFRLQDVELHGRSPGMGSATAARVDMELSLTALLRGEILFIEADIDSPTVTVPVGADRSVTLPGFGAAEADRVSLVHLVLRDGTLVLTNPAGKPALTTTGITGDGEAESLTGPFKFAGSVETPRGPLALHLATGTYENRKLRLKIAAEAAAGVPKTDIDGIVSTLAAPDGASTLTFDGSLASGDARPLAGTVDTLPWRLTANLHAEPGRIEASEGELRAGIDGRALIAAVTGSLTLGNTPTAKMTLHARQADIGRLAAPPEGTADADAAPAGTASPMAGALAVLGALAGDADLTAGLPLPVTVDYGIDTVSAGQLTLANLAGHVTLAQGAPVAGTLSIATPDESSVAFDGTFEPGSAAVFKGQVTAATGHLQRIADSLDADLPAVAAAIRQDLPVDAFAAAGTVDLSGVGFAAHDLALTLDKSRFAGTVTLTRTVGRDRARLFADLTSDALDLEALPAWRDTARAAAGLDVTLSLVARALRLASDDTGSVNAGRIALDLRTDGPVVTLNRLSLADIGGATAEITGRSDGTAARAEGHLDARRLHDLLALVDRLAPGAIADAVLARADALSPALLTIAAEARVGADGTPAPTLLTLDGTVAGTTVALHLDPAAGQAAAGVAPFKLTATLQAPDSGTLLRQAGVAVAPASAVGRARIEATVRRDGGGAVAGTVNATLGDTVLTLDGHGDGVGEGTARVTLKSANAAPLARALMIAMPDAGAVWPGDGAGTMAWRDRRVTLDGLTGQVGGTPFKGSLAYVFPVLTPVVADTGVPALTGTLMVDRLPLAMLAAPVLGPLPVARPGALWADAPFGPALLALPRSEIVLKIPTLPLTDGVVAREAAATLRLSPGAVTLADLSARLGDGRVGGTVTLRRDGGAASLAGHVTWSALPIASPAVGGISRGGFDVAGTGASVGAVMASLAGSGTLDIEGARLPRFDPTAITRVIATTDAATATIDVPTITQQLGQELDRAALALGTVSTPLSLAAGVLRSEAVKVQGPIVSAEASGSLDLRNLLLSLKATASLRAPPKDWVGTPPQVGIVWHGAFGAPTRAVDAATLVNGIAARAIARDLDRIAAFQDDVRERAFFARRLKAIEAEQQAERDKAKAADADRRLQQLLQTSMPDASHPMDISPSLAKPRVPVPPPRPGAPLRP